MTGDFLERLKNSGADTEGAVARFIGNTELYYTCLCDFENDGVFYDIGRAAADGNGKALLEALHTLKGLSGNLGLSTIYTLSSEAVGMLRAGDVGGAMGELGHIRHAVEEYEAVMSFPSGASLMLNY